MEKRPWLMPGLFVCSDNCCVVGLFLNFVCRVLWTTPHNGRGIPMTIPNLFSNVPGDIPEEIFESLLDSRTVRIERIISQGQSSPADFWYDQDTNEWVVVLKGSARLLFDGESVPLEL